MNSVKAITVLKIRELYEYNMRIPFSARASPTICGSLKGCYLTPAGLPYSERRKESNMSTLTLEPHSASMPDIVKSLESELQVFEEGVRIVVNGVTTMPQQPIAEPCHTTQ